jgi:hypothetical protein
MLSIARAVRLLVVGVAVTAFAVVGLNVTPAGATTTGQVIRIAPESNPFLTLDVSGGSRSAGAQVIQWTLNGGPNQMWRLEPHGTGYWIVNINSGLCLGDAGQGQPVVQWYCGDAPNGTVWSTSLSANNLLAYSIGNVWTGRYLDVTGGSGSAGTALTTWPWNGGSHQYFLATTV